LHLRVQHSLHAETHHTPPLHPVLVCSCRCGCQALHHSLCTLLLPPLPHKLPLLLLMHTGPGTPGGAPTFLSPGAPYQMGANPPFHPGPPLPGASPAYAAHQQFWGAHNRGALLPGASPAGRHMLPGGCSAAALTNGPGLWGTIPESELDAWFRGSDLDLLGTPGGPAGGGLGLGAMFKDDPHTLMDDTRTLLGPLAPAGVMG
jgi:hypothetical protein